MEKESILKLLLSPIEGDLLIGLNLALTLTGDQIKEILPVYIEEQELNTVNRPYIPNNFYVSNGYFHIFVQQTGIFFSYMKKENITGWIEKQL